MTIKITEIEATAEDLKNSRTLGEALVCAIQNLLPGNDDYCNEEAEDEE